MNGNYNTPLQSGDSRKRGSLNGLPFVVRRVFTYKTWYHQQMVKYCGYYEVSEAPTFKES